MADFPFSGLRNKSRESMEFHTQRLLSDPFGPKVLIQFPDYVTADETVYVGRFVRFPENGMGIITEDGINKVVPHTGSIHIKKNVIILEHALLVRPVNKDTVIGENTVIGIRAHIGHNVNIGKNVFVTSGAMICGSVIIEDNVDVGARSVIVSRVRIGRGAIIGIGSVVICDIPAGEVWAGNPAKRIK